MEIIILDKNLNPLAPVNSMRTLIWDRRAKEPGMFEIHCGAADFESIEGGAYVYRMDRDELGVIQEANLSRDESGARVCYAKGYFAECMLDDRVVDVTQHLAGEPEDIARDLVNMYFINASGYAGRAVKDIELGARSVYKQEPTMLQATGKPVGTVITGIEETQDLMHRLRFDFARQKLVFIVTKGRESGAIFSDEYANIRSATYHRDGSDAPNVVFVAGAGEGAERKRITIDLRDSPDDYAREMYVDARDLQQSWEEDGVTKYYTDADYNVLLYNRGMEKIAGHKVLENFQVDADPRANLVYLDDYDIGDWCIMRVTVHGALKFELARQITAIKETYEAGKMSIAITFGDYGPRSLNSYVAQAVAVNEVVPSAAAGGGEDLSKLTTEDKSSLVRATNEVNSKLGNLNDLQTTEKDTLVEAINELEEEIGETEELDVDLPLDELDPEIPPEEQKPTDLTSAVNALQRQITKGGGGGSGGEDARIGDMSTLKTTDKKTVVGAVNETYNMAIPSNMGAVVAFVPGNNPPSGATAANFTGTGELDASGAYSVNVSTISGSAPADGGALSFTSTNTNFCKQEKKTITLVHGLPLYGFCDAGVATVKVSGQNYSVPRSLRGGAVLINMSLTLSSNSVNVKASAACDLTGGYGLTVDSKPYVAYVPKCTGLPSQVFAAQEEIGPEVGTSPYLYQPYLPVQPVASGNKIVTGIAAGENVFEVTRYEYTAAIFVPSVVSYGTKRIVKSLTFAGWAQVRVNPGTYAMTFVKWLSAKHR